MKKILITKDDLVGQLKHSFSVSDKSLDELCNDINTRIGCDSKDDKLKLFNRDLLWRILNGRFVKFSPHVKYLCKYYGVSLNSNELDEDYDTKSLAKEINQFDQLVNTDPDFNKKFSSLNMFLSNIVDLGYLVKINPGGESK